MAKELLLDARREAEEWLAWTSGPRDTDPPLWTGDVRFIDLNAWVAERFARALIGIEDV